MDLLKDSIFKAFKEEFEDMVITTEKNTYKVRLTGLDVLRDEVDEENEFMDTEE